MKKALKQLLDNLDAIVEEGHDELLDTDVREQMADAVHQTLVDPQEDYELPDTFGMFSDEGNAMVKTALEKFLSHAEVAAAKKIPTAAARLDAFQDIDVESTEGNTYDEYFGYDDSYEE